MKYLPVSVIIPCRNEENYITQVIENIIQQDYPKEFTEVFFVDGLSEDNTAAIIQRYAKAYSFIKFLQNKNKIVPYALNTGIKASSGEVIIRMDAHSNYPKNYINSLVSHLELLKADNVGGVWITKPGNGTIIALAIAEATSSIFGIGNAYYRLVNNDIKQVDTVPFGCYRRDVFDKIGLFDEDLVRNQDDEFNARLIKNGGRIFLIPSIEIVYFARTTLSKMCKMFYQYGLFKPLVNRKNRKPATIRQFFPLGLLTYLIVLVLMSVFSGKVSLLPFSPLGIYLLLNCYFSIKIAWARKKIRLVAFLPWIFPLVHLSYGMGYLIGIFRFQIFNRKIRHSAYSPSR